MVSCLSVLMFISESFCKVRGFLGLLLSKLFASSNVHAQFPEMILYLSNYANIDCIKYAYINRWSYLNIADFFQCFHTLHWRLSWKWIIFSIFLLLLELFKPIKNQSTYKTIITVNLLWQSMSFCSSLPKFDKKF